MTVSFNGVGAAFLAVLVAAPALAAPATPEGAARLAGVLQRYFGSTEGVVAVAPANERYDLTLDFAPLLRLIPVPEASFTASPQHLTLTDQGGGLWAVAQDEPVSFAAQAPGAFEIELSMAAVRWQGTFDESLPGFQGWTADMNDMVVTESLPGPDGAGTTQVSYAIASLHSEYKGEKALSGGVDGEYSSVGTGFRESMTMPDTPAMPGGMTVDVAAETIAQRGTFSGMRTGPIQDLVAWFVAHPSADALTSGQEELRPLVQAALPLFDRLDATVDYKGLAVTGPFGTATVQSVGGVIEMNGLVADGRLRESITVDGLALPAGLVPDWATGLVPESFGFDVEGSGFNLADPARRIVDAVNLAADPPIANDMAAPLLAALLPEGDFDLVLAPAQVTAPLYQVNYEGAMTVSVIPGEIPTGQGKVRMTGVEAVVEALNKAPPEVFESVGPLLMMTRGIAKPGAPGELVWNIDATAPGKVLVNDLDLMALGAE
jgi:hypothetical protein